MDFQSRTTALIVDRLVRGQNWPESSRNYWLLAEKENQEFFNRRALCTGCWAEEDSEYNTMNYWEGVPSASVSRWMDRFRLIVLQADELSWDSYGNYERWEQQWLKTMATGQLVDW